MGTFNLLVFDPEQAVARSVVNILEDWHASAWLSDYGLVSLAEITAHGANLADLAVRLPASAAEGPRWVRLLDIRDGREVRLIAIDIIGCGEDWRARRDVLQAGCGTLGASLELVARVDVMVPSHGSQWDPDLGPWPGWDTSICAPEQSPSVESAGLPVFYDASSPESLMNFAAHVAAYTATVAGLWAGSRPSFFDHTDATDEFRLGRVQHRRVSATEIADRIRAGVLNAEQLHSQAAQSALSNSDVRSRARELQVQLVPQPPRKGRAAAQRVGAWAALVMYVKFLAAALIRSPREVAAGLSYSAKSRMANAVQGMVFGQDSAKTVTVAGVAADNRTDELESLQNQLTNLDSRLRDLPGVRIPETGSGASQGAFWQACLDGAFALVSGAQQGSVRPVIQESKARYFRIDDVAPNVGRWRPRGQLLVGVPVEGVALHDTRAVHGALQAMSQSSASGGSWQTSTDEQQAELSEAYGPWERSYMGQVGISIASQLAKHERRVTELVRELQRPQEADNAEAETLVHSLRTFGRASLFGGIGCLGVIWLLKGIGVLAGLAIMLTGLVLVGWLIALMTKYVKTKQALLKLQNRRDDAANAEEQALAELPVAVENARRLAKLYAQYRIWAPALSAFLAQPFGRSEDAGETFSGMAGAVPKTVSCGVYRAVDEDAARRCVAEIAEGLRPEVRGLWRQLVTTTYAELVGQTPHLRSVGPDDVLQQVDTQSDSFLAGFRKVMLAPDADAPAVRPSIAAQIDRQQMQRITSTIDRHRLAELRRAFAVEQVGAGGKPSTQRLTDQVSPALFNVDFFSAAGIQSEMRRADEVIVSSSEIVTNLPTRHWLDEIDSAVVYSPSTNAAAFELRTAVAQAEETVNHAPQISIQGM